MENKYSLWDWIEVLAAMLGTVLPALAAVIFVILGLAWVIVTLVGGEIYLPGFLEN